METVFFLSVGLTTDLEDADGDSSIGTNPSASVGISFPICEDSKNKLIYFAGSELNYTVKKGYDVSATIKFGIEQQAEGYLTFRGGLNQRGFYYSISNE